MFDWANHDWSGILPNGGIILNPSTTGNSGKVITTPSGYEDLRKSKTSSNTGAGQTCDASTGYCPYDPTTWSVTDAGEADAVIWENADAVIWENVDALGVEQSNESNTESNTEEEPKGFFRPWMIVLGLAGAATYFFFPQIRKALGL